MKTTSRRTLYQIATNEEYPLDVRYEAIKRMKHMQYKARERTYCKRKSKLIGG